MKPAHHAGGLVLLALALGLADVFAVFGPLLAAAYEVQALLWSANGLALWSLARRPLSEGGTLAGPARAIVRCGGS